MFGESHNLATEFPEYKEQIHQLKMEDRHFARLFDEYHEVDDQLHRIEQGIEVHADEFVETLKLRRLHLKDELFDMLKKVSD
ncbi:YdcH family protein [Thiothrix subterranea]|uniref:YdcH family protein n=1 Tax=Thiothrix subterranea TaxID=2735563 RepID=UPI00192C5383|nr:YdcH family protein [Thiothrix subterranea]QQZ29160.1 YdcH family protein [Thiothrix subterranea]